MRFRAAHGSQASSLNNDDDTAPSPPRIRDQARLPRRTAESYRGLAAVHWTMTLDQPTTGWLDTVHHTALREILLHTYHRDALACPACCLMSDHAHFLWLSLHAASDQRLAAAWFRRHWNALLPPTHTLQRQAYDHVLRDTEREQNAFTAIATHLLQNVERAHLVSDWKTWPHLGAIFPGVHPLDPRAPDHRDRFWREHNRRVHPRRSKTSSSYRKNVPHEDTAKVIRTQHLARDPTGGVINSVDAMVRNLNLT